MNRNARFNIPPYAHLPAEVWAFPKSEYEIQRDARKADLPEHMICPFRFEIKESGHRDWNDKAFRVKNVEVAAYLNDIEDIYQLLLDTLTAKQKKIREDAEKEIEKVEEFKREILLLTGPEQEAYDAQA